MTNQNEKIINPGSVKERTQHGRLVDAQIFCAIRWSGKKLSITGVIGPNPGGNSYGGCGQIDMEFAHRNPEDDDKRYTNPVKPEDITFNPGWNKDIWLYFLDVWNEWHLNDMRGECVHQRKMGWKYDDHRGMFRKVAFTPRNETEMREIIAVLETSEPGFEYSPSGLPDWRYRLSDDGELEQWDQFRGHPCPICGYSIGSAWLYEDVPDEVIKFLNDLPHTQVSPAWV